jgi:hypothetical protein
VKSLFLEVEMKVLKIRIACLELKKSVLKFFAKKFLRFAFKKCSSAVADAEKKYAASGLEMDNVQLDYFRYQADLLKYSMAKMDKK